MKKTVCVSVKELYEHFGDRTQAGYRIEHTKENENDFYDLFNKDGVLVACDGEENEIVKQDFYGKELKNISSGETFFLTISEISLATYENKSPFSYEELTVLSNGLLALIRDASTARGLVNDTAAHEAITKEIEKLTALNSKVCGIMRD